MIPNRSYLILKRGLDIVLSATAILALSPLFCIIYCIIKIDSRGPGLFIHERLGYKGKKLKLIKFRTMVAGSQKSLKNEEEERDFYRQFKLQNDSRVTKVGKYLRKYSLDELPQFLNILFGSMTLVGPRPIISEEARWYGIHLPLLLSVKPGITSFWSIKGRNQSLIPTGPT
jgi:lipopolysaccharide/colanic/teichoic acid biosynthesis glycosyltransferase